MEVAKKNISMAVYINILCYVFTPASVADNVTLIQDNQDPYVAFDSCQDAGLNLLTYAEGQLQETTLEKLQVCG